ncbi:probable disease resistance protein At4g27220 [Beta vulgaris subsp. vulgaris]|uniref:probable disease resistance protein At4g27220 n=1 Tax=Beta vulgaris subsp. vulgaris TaxID=3555 RepID=UPI002548E8F0|nr:probable disease resistance protein At4g27220 [Beta vulgaris subsp. vulgaris]
MAGSMRAVNNIQEWRNTLEELQNSTEGQAVIETDIFPVLKLSYDCLKDPKLRQCFALYPKYGEITRDELIVLFRSEGLLDTIQNWQKQFDKGHSMLNKLENVCLLERYDSKCVKMHNFIRDMAIRITNVMPRFMIAAEIQPGTLPMCPCLTTLLLQENPFTKLPDSFFLHMKSMKVLNLSRTSIKKLPNSISELENLRTLLLEFCRRLHFVPSLKKLTKLRELDFSFCWAMKDVPHGIEQLFDLRFLDLEGSKDLCQLLSSSLSAFSHIQCLILDPDVQSISGDDIIQLGYLERLEGCRLDYYEFVIGEGEYKRVDYCTSEERIVILCSGSDRKGDVFVLPENIQNLQIHNSELDAKSLIDALPSLTCLTELRKILIRRCRVIQVTWSPKSYSDDAASVVLLQHINELFLTDLQDFTSLVKEGVALQRGAFSNLKILVIKYCPKIKKLFTPNLLHGNLDNLQELEVEGCEELGLLKIMMIMSKKKVIGFLT